MFSVHSATRSKGSSLYRIRLWRKRRRKAKATVISPEVKKAITDVRSDNARNALQFYAGSCLRFKRASIRKRRMSEKESARRKKFINDAHNAVVFHIDAAGVGWACYMLNDFFPEYGPLPTTPTSAFAQPRADHATDAPRESSQ